MIERDYMNAESFFKDQRTGISIALAVLFISQGFFWIGVSNNTAAFFVLFFLCVVFMVWLSRVCLLGEIVFADFPETLPPVDKFLILLSHLSLIAIGVMAYMLLRRLDVLPSFATMIPITVTIVSFVIHFRLLREDLKSKGFSLKWFSTPSRLAGMFFIYGFLLYLLVRIGMALHVIGDLP